MRRSCAAVWMGTYIEDVDGQHSRPAVNVNRSLVVAECLCVAMEGRGGSVRALKDAA